MGKERKEEERIRLMVEGVEEMEKKMVRRERRRNVLIKRLKVEEGKVKAGIEKVMAEIRVKVKIEEVRQIRTGKEE